MNVPQTETFRSSCPTEMDSISIFTIDKNDALSCSVYGQSKLQILQPWSFCVTFNNKKKYLGHSHMCRWRRSRAYHWNETAPMFRDTCGALNLAVLAIISIIRSSLLGCKPNSCFVVLAAVPALPFEGYLHSLPTQEFQVRRASLLSISGLATSCIL